MVKIDSLINIIQEWCSELKEAREIKPVDYRISIPNELIRLTNILRQQQLLDMPKHALQNQHVNGACLLANRKELLLTLPKNGIVAELGVDNGEFSQKIIENCSPQKLYLVDVWDTERYNETKALDVYKKFSDQIEIGKVEIKRSLSVHAAKTFDDEVLDWVYIDTDHSYKTTLAELYAYSPKVKKNGFIAGHDYVMGNWGSSYKYGVIEAVAEFCFNENWRISHLTADYTENNSFAIKRI